ncbi:DUF1214 domain-containing protein [Haliea sp. E17]|uniref:DUF1214 domain-containing protein n=1 Tax=Haliea sp. E17 TaxID=3401576 RepID=UPI003AAE46B5
MENVCRIALGALLLNLCACSGQEPPPLAPSESPAPVAAQSMPKPDALDDSQIDAIVRHSYPFVAMYNVNNKFALKQGWNNCVADTVLKDATMTDIARPNNDTLYISCMLDLRAEPVIIEFPAFESKYVSLMVTGYDHYVNVPLSVTKGDFHTPGKVLFYTSRTAGYEGAPVDGIDQNFEMTGDFVSAVFRVMPHANEPERFARIIEQMKSVEARGLSEFKGDPAKPLQDPGFPQVGQTDSDVYANNFPQVLQFAINHSTLDPNDPVDQQLLAALAPMGIAPGNPYDPVQIHGYDGTRFRNIADKIRQEEFSRMLDGNSMNALLPRMFRTRGHIDADTLLFQSVVGPIGLPASEAVYPAILTDDGEVMNALNDYVIQMARDQLPPARAFWSVTLYDSANGFFIPNERKKYSVGENGGMKLDAEGGITIHIAAEKPEGVPEKNWLPIVRKDQDLDVIMRIYDPDLDAFAHYELPKAQKISE